MTKTNIEEKKEAGDLLKILGIKLIQEKLEIIILGI